MWARSNSGTQLAFVKTNTVSNSDSPSWSHSICVNGPVAYFDVQIWDDDWPFSDDLRASGKITATNPKGPSCYATWSNSEGCSDKLNYQITVTGTTARPTSNPITSNPTTPFPTRSPSTSSPTKHPTTSSPTLSPVTSAPTKNPTTSSPTPNPVTGSPSKNPTTNSPTTGKRLFELCVSSDYLARDQVVLPSNQHWHPPCLLELLDCQVD